MNVILLKNYKTLGTEGAIVSVSDGYALNFLFPQKIAQAATKNACVEAKNKKEVVEEKEAQKKEELVATAQKIKGAKISIGAKAKDNKLFGSIGEKEIAQAISDKCAVSVAPEMITLKEHIKELTTQEIVVDLGHDVTASIILTVKAG